MKEIDNQTLQMMEINVRQKEHYEFDINSTFTHDGNAVSKIWDNFRMYYYKIIATYGIEQKLYENHKKWLGDLTGKKVLDLGCHTGNALSEYIAMNSKEYVAVDLSSSAIEVFKNKFTQSGIQNAKFVCVDFLSDDFVERDFDIVYAIDVFHHFKYFDCLFERVKSVIKKNGIIITSDPMNTFLPLKLIRTVYRLFQSDRNWEYPFTKKTISSIHNNFEVVDYLGIMGKMKYAVLIYIFSKNLVSKAASKWIELDFHQTQMNSRSFRKLLRVSFLLRNSK